VAEQYADLFERIRDHCQRQGWYGPDAAAPAKFANRYERSFSLKTGQMYVRDRWADPRTSRFPYPPAAEDQLQTTEAQLGMPLPGVLRALYATVGNGGFGPAYGLVGAMGGAPSADVMPDEDEEMFAVLLNSSDYAEPTADADPVGTFARDTLTQDNPAPGRPREEPASSDWEERPQRPSKDRTLAATLRRSQWRVPERVALALEQETDRYLECEEQPDGWVTLCDWGCAIYSNLDLWSGRIYLTYAVQRHDVVVKDPREVRYEDCALGVVYQAASVEDWLVRWLRGELDQGHARRLTLLSDLTAS
jgi:hypothetical protein